MAFDDKHAVMHSASSSSSSSSAQALQMRQQPEQVWFKDCGGRSNVLVATVGATVTQPVALKVTLVLEDGTVPDQASLLDLTPSLKGDDCFAIGPGVPFVTIRFKIRKVSRNFDNSRFVLRVEPDYSKTPAAVALEGCSSFPILVKSKRRRSTPAQPSPARSPASSDGDAASLLRTLVAQQEENGRLLRHVLSNQQSILTRLAALEAEPSSRGGPHATPAPRQALHQRFFGPASNAQSHTPPSMPPVEPPPPLLRAQGSSRGAMTDTNPAFSRQGTSSSVGSSNTALTDGAIAGSEFYMDAAGMLVARTGPTAPTSRSSSSSSGALLAPSLHAVDEGLAAMSRLADAAMAEGKRPRGQQHGHSGAVSQAAQHDHDVEADDDDDVDDDDDEDYA